MTAAGRIVAGIDEAGRGALAGPVVAGACVIRTELFTVRGGGWSPLRRNKTACVIADSKQLTPEQRERAFAWITAHCAWGVGMADAAEIERIGILRANEQAMRRAVEHLRTVLEPALLRIDGSDNFRFAIPHESIVRGDQTEPEIAAASIVAKCTRDSLMVAAHAEHPVYGFDRHKGYGSEEHIAAIRTHGPCVLHRPYFLTRILNPEPQLTLTF